MVTLGRLPIPPQMIGVAHRAVFSDVGFLLVAWGYFGFRSLRKSLGGFRETRFHYFQKAGCYQLLWRSMRGPFFKGEPLRCEPTILELIALVRQRIIVAIGH